MSKPFGYVYDERMLAHECHYDGTVAECPERIRRIHERLQKDGLLDGAIKIEAREATDTEILLNHPQSLIDEIVALNTEQKCEDYCRDKEYLWTCESTNSAARVAIGGCIELVRAALDDRIHNGFAIVRPPGHHSYGKVPQGYCIFNNVAIAAKYALESGVKRLAIVDFDYHAGNGTHPSVKEDPRIHFTSIHSFHHGCFWPFNREYDYATNDANALMVPLNGVMNSEGDFVSVFHHVLVPMLEQFEPELILISAGFDAGFYDGKAEFGQGVKAHGYGHMARLLSNICPRRMIAVLEGGYQFHNYTECAAMFTRGLMSLPLPRLDLPPRMSGALLETTWNLLHHHSKWYPKLEQRLAMMVEQQKAHGLPQFVPNQTVYLGEKMRALWDDVTKHKLVRTREWLPELSAEMLETCRTRIAEYVAQYEFTEEHASPSEQQLVAQCIWDETARSDAFLQAAPYVSVLVQQFNDFVAGRRENMMICDRELYREAVERGIVDAHEPMGRKH